MLSGVPILLHERVLLVQMSMHVSTHISIHMSKHMAPHMSIHMSLHTSVNTHVHTQVSPLMQASSQRVSAHRQTSWWRSATENTNEHIAGGL